MKIKGVLVNRYWNDGDHCMPYEVGEIRISKEQLEQYFLQSLEEEKNKSNGTN